MVKLTLLDGTLDLGEEQKQVLLKTPYFEALFLRWSEQEQTEYEVELTVNTVRLLLGEVTQLNVLTQAAKQAVEEARRELDMVGVVVNSIDVESPVYPINLYPFLEPYTIKKNPALSVMPDVPTPEMYRLMFDWDSSPVQPRELNRLVGRVNPETFPAYLRLFWQKSPAEFLEQTFTDAVTQQILLHPEIFQEYPKTLQARLTERMMNIPTISPLYSFYRTVLQLDMKEWIEQALRNCPRHYLLMKIVRHDPTSLFRCLKLAAENNHYTWLQFQELLGIFNGVKEYPLTKEEIQQFDITPQRLIQEWAEKQIFLSLGAETYQSKFLTEFNESNFNYCDRVLNIFPAHPFPVHLSNARKLSMVMNWLKVYPQLLVTVADNIYSHPGFTVEELEFLLPYTPAPEFGINKVVYSDHVISLLHKYNAHAQPGNVFIGSPKVATKMVYLTLEAGVIPNGEYLTYFFEQKMWHLLPLLENCYKKYPRRLQFLHETLLKQAPEMAKIFLQWETSLC